MLAWNNNERVALLMVRMICLALPFWGGRSVGERHAEMDATSEEKRAHAEVVELAAVVALDGLDDDAELSTDMGEEVLQSGESVRLLAQRKSPQIMRAVIEDK